MQSTNGVACSTKSPAPIFRIGRSRVWGKLPPDEVELKFLENQPTNNPRKIRPNDERGTDADQQHFIDCAHWGECFGTDRGTQIRLHNCLRGGLCDRAGILRSHDTHDAVVQPGGLLVTFIAWVEFGTERRQQCAGGRSGSCLF
jgi:hypothetical protein